MALHEALLRVIAEDNSVGTTPGAARSALVNLEHLADHLGGELRLDTGRRGGARLAWQVPVPTTD